MKFNIESPFFQFMNSLAIFIGLNVLFLILCLPIITIGPALTALYTVTIQEAKKEHKIIFFTFLKAFKENFIQSSCIFLIQLSLGLIFLFNIVFWSEQQSIIGTICLIIFVIASFFLGISFLYSFPLIARYNNTLSQTIKNSIFIPILHLKETLAIILIPCFVLVVSLFLPEMKVFMILLGFSFVALCNSYFFIKVFSYYENKEETSSLI